MTEDEIAVWHHRFSEHELGQTPGDNEGQGGLACCSPWDHKESETTERLNYNKDFLQLMLLLICISCLDMEMFSNFF